jgi:invasion protein IalB
VGPVDPADIGFILPTYPFVCDLLKVTRCAARRCFFLARMAAARLSALRRDATSRVDSVAGALSATAAFTVSTAGFSIVFSKDVLVRRHF